MWREEAGQKLENARQLAVQHSWEAAEQAEREFRRWLYDTTGRVLQKIPGLPPLLNSQIQIQLSIEEDVEHTNPCTEIASRMSVIEENGHFVNLSNNRHLMDLLSMHPCFQLTGTQDGQFVALTTTGKTWTVNGLITVVKDGSTLHVPIVGSIGGLVDSNDFWGVRWNIITSHITATMPGGYAIHLNLLEGDDNTFTIDTNGVGQLSVSFKTLYPTHEWGAILPYLNWIQLPVAISGGVLAVQIPLTDSESFIIHEPWASSDYDDDGVFDYETDFSAYMNGLNNQALRADLNNDGVWDQTDIDLWSTNFWIDNDAAQ